MKASLHANNVILVAVHVLTCQQVEIMHADISALAETSWNERVGTGLC